MKNKIAMIGNMNNNFFVLMRYLIDEDMDCHLFVLPYEPKHFSPENDTWDKDILENVTKLEWGNVTDFSKISKSKILKDLKGFSHFIACGTGLAYLNKADINIDMFIPYGGDLVHLPFNYPKNPLKWMNAYRFMRHQKRGIKHSSYCSMSDESAIFLNILNDLNFKGERLTSGVPMVYPLKNNNYQNSEIFLKFKRIRENNDLVIFHQSRHVWKSKKESINKKRNDILFVALSEFKKKHPALRIGIITFEYGVDVDESKKLIKKLGISDSVYWFNLMARKELMIGLKFTDIVAGEFHRSWFIYGVVFEAMASKKPIMHFREDSLYPNMNLYPMLQANSVDEVIHWMDIFFQDKKRIQDIGEKSYDWYSNYFIKNSIDDVKMVLGKK